MITGYTEEQKNRLREGLKKKGKERSEKKAKLLEKYPMKEGHGTYSLSPLEYARVKELQEAMEVVYGECGDFEIIFTKGNGIGNGVKVWFKLSNKTYDITDVESW